MLVHDEGIAYAPYKDTKGYWTIGVGYFIGKELTDLKLSWDTIDQMLKEKIEECLEDLNGIFGDKFDMFEDARQLALLSMMYSMGVRRFSQFVKMIGAIKARDWETAGFEAQNSKWASDVDPKGLANAGRDARVAYMLRSGCFHPEYKL
jgi:GH24 family phage-related lysozyme (muramidase)